MVLESQYEQKLAALFMKTVWFSVCLFSVCFIQNTKSVHFIFHDYSWKIIFTEKYLRNCESIWELSRHHEIMVYADNAATDTIGVDHLWRSVPVSASAYMWLTPEFIFFPLQLLKDTSPCSLQLHIVLHDFFLCFKG